MSILLRAEIHGLAGRAAELRDVLAEHVAALRATEGCTGASASVALDAPHGELTLESWWHDEAALRAHYATPAYSRYTQAVSPLLARPSDVVVHYVDRSVHATAELDADPARLG